MDTLIIWMSYQGVDLYLLPWHEASLYQDIDTCYDPDNRKVEHLGYMLGQNEYFGEIPEYSKFVSGDGWDVNCQKSKAIAPLGFAPCEKWHSRLSESCPSNPNGGIGMSLRSRACAPELALPSLRSRACAPHMSTTTLQDTNNMTTYHYSHYFIGQAGKSKPKWYSLTGMSLDQVLEYLHKLWDTQVSILYSMPIGVGDGKNMDVVGVIRQENGILKYFELGEEPRVIGPITRIPSLLLPPRLIDNSPIVPH